jgi:hypothetical protein
MTEQEPRIELPADVRAALHGARVVITATDDGSDPAYAVAREVAVAVAREADAALVLVDRSSESDWSTPTPTERGRSDRGCRRASPR